ncbi:MAG: hypothetical protein SFX73_27840 [Kofleriaceae bacterium]|nr:hypothetical protein [Kofleriaceae bacterium]
MWAIPLLLLFRLQRYAIDARRLHRTSAHYAWTVLAALCAAVLVAVTAVITIALFQVGLWWAGLITLGPAGVPVLGLALVRRVFVPLGWYRAAYVFGYASRPGKDPGAYALCVAAWALGRAPSASGEAWIASRRNTRVPLGDAEVVTTALLAAARDDIATARTLMRSTLMLAESHPAVRELAGEWLACDAAERGAWRELDTDAVAARFPASPMTFLLEGIAACMLRDEHAPKAFELHARWVMAPYRRATRPLVQQALNVAPEQATVTATDVEPEADIATPPERAPLPRAIAAHLAFGAGRATATTFCTTVRAWDAALTDPTTHTWLARRAIELDAPLGAVDRALRELTTVISDDLARIADAARLGAPASHGPIGEALARRLRHGRLDALEDAFNAWIARRDQYVHRGQLASARPPIDEWREFIALQNAYAAAVTAGGVELRRLAFPHAFTTGSNMAAWLWNELREFSISHAISQWLLEEALAVGDAEAIELGHRNCALRVPTRLDDDFASTLDR